VFATWSPLSRYHLAFHPPANSRGAGDHLHYDRVYRITKRRSACFYRGLGRPQGLAFDPGRESLRRRIVRRPPRCRRISRKAMPNMSSVARRCGLALSEWPRNSCRQQFPVTLLECPRLPFHAEAIATNGFEGRTLAPTFGAQKKPASALSDTLDQPNSICDDKLSVPVCDSVQLGRSAGELQYPHERKSSPLDRNS